MMKYTLPLLNISFISLLLLLTLFTSFCYADPVVEQKKIQFLINHIAKSEVRFIRNGSEYSAKEAASHLKMKLNNAQNSWFAPDKSKWTAVMFIEKIASKSSMSGKPYQIKLKTGKLVNSGDWLKAALESFDLKN